MLTQFKEKVYKKLATRPFPETPAALHLLEPPVADFMSGRITTSSTKLEEYTAIIADRMFEEWCAAAFAEAALREHGVSLQDQLAAIREDVDSAMDRARSLHLTGTSPSPRKGLPHHRGPLESVET